MYVYSFGVIGILISCNLSQEKIRNESLKLSEELDVFFQEHDLFTGMYKDCLGRWIGFPCVFICGVIVFALGIFFNIKLYRLLRQNQQHITPETRKMQMTLYRTYTIS
uniref:Uncharacterized protein n=1 Tax=Acrobeloides nanus TaxID=290746 RepID=A0A914DXM0_9BILA